MRRIEGDAVHEIVSVGYQGKKLRQFCESLQQAGVEVLIDVRQVAWSQRPEFRKGAVRGALAEFGINYVHCREAGNPYRPKAGQPLEREACMELYRRHLSETPGVISLLKQQMAGRRAALFCYEGDRDHCHRGVLISELTREMPHLRVVDL